MISFWLKLGKLRTSVFCILVTMKLFSFLFLILLVLEEFNCAPISNWYDYGDVEDWRNIGLVNNCGFGGSQYNGWNSSRWWQRVRYLSHTSPRPTDYETMTNEGQLPKETADKPSNKISEKSIDIATKPFMKPLIDISSKTLDEPSRKSINEPSTNPAESSAKTLSDIATVSPLDDIPAEILLNK